MYYEIGLSIFGSIYLTIGVLLILRRNNPRITKNSPWLLNLLHWANFCELALVLPTATEIVEDQNYSTTFKELRDSGILISHFIIYFSYLLRSYRLFTIFQLSYTQDFSKYMYKTTQKWLIKVLVLLLFPVILIAAILIFLPEFGDYFPISESGNTYDKRTASSCIYVTVCFLEQILLVFIVYRLRFVDTKYNMNNELIWVTAFWFISPIFSIFVNTNRKIWLVSIVARNLLLMIRSSLIPILNSMRKSKFEEPLTIDMLNSLEIILEIQKPLRYFENFLRNSEEGLLILEFYQKCECKLALDSTDDFGSVNAYLSANNLPLVLKIESIESKTELVKAKSVAFKYLNENFYSKFLDSEECKELKEMIQKEEIITNRLRNTSIFRKFYLAASGPDSEEISRTSKKIGTLLI